MVKQDIRNRDDIFNLIENFYQKLLIDPSINYIFLEVAEMNPAVHFPILVDFWDMVLFQKDTYRKNAMQIHLDLDRLTAFTKDHFNTWLRYFTETIDELFEGEMAFLAKQRAQSIATTMQIKILQR